MTGTVHLHIGEPKTGTMTIQAMLHANQAILRRGGMLVPGRPIDHVRGGQEVLARRRARGGQTEVWQRMARQIAQSRDSDAVISMESLVRATREQARFASTSFGEAEVRVVLTLRDLARVVPAQWQESLQFRHDWTLDQYLEGVMHPQSYDTAAGRSFWQQHDVAAELELWTEVVGVDRISVVTVPRSASSPMELWDRFCQAIGADPAPCKAVAPTNESLGAASAELLRRLNVALGDAPIPTRQYLQLCRQLLSKKILASRRETEPRVTAPYTFRAWAHERSETIAETVAASGVRVIGALDDLRAPPPDPQHERSTPAPPTDSDVAEAAVQGLAGLVLALVADRAQEEHGQGAGTPRRRD